MSNEYERTILGINESLGRTLSMLRELYELELERVRRRKRRLNPRDESSYPSQT